MNVVIVKHRKEDSSNIEVIGVFSSADLAELYIERNKDKERFSGIWYISDRQIDELIKQS